MQVKTDSPLSNEQQDIVDLLRHELSELANKDHACLDNGVFEEQEELLYEHYIHLEHIGNAMDLAGLTGLALCCKRLSANFKQLSENKIPAPQNLQQPLSQWANFFLEYLQDLGRPEKEHEHCEKIVGFLLQPELVQPFSEAEAQETIEQFDLSLLASFNDADEHPIPLEVTDPMVSLDIPDDIRPELLQGMLIELPEQMRQLESSISHFLDSGHFSDLAQAQRIAHTVKGAANTVSIQGLASLTHYTEDLLETAAKQLDTAPAGFENLLIQVSDCIVSTAEYLNRQGPEPSDIRDVMQLLLNWLNQLKQGKIKEPDAEYQVDQPAPIKPPSVQAPPPSTEEAILLVSDDGELSDNTLTDNTLSDSTLSDSTLSDSTLSDSTLTDSILIDSILIDSTLTDNALTESTFIDETLTAGMLADESLIGESETWDFNSDDEASSPEAQLDLSSLLQADVAPSKPAAEKKESSPAKKSLHFDENERFINLPESRAHELLRLSGEVQIANNQVNSQISTMQSSMVQTERYHNQIKAMAAHLEKLIQSQSALQAVSRAQNADEIDPLELDRFNELHTFANQLMELTTDSYETIANIDHQIRELSVLNLQQKRLNDDNQHILLQLNLTAADTLSSRFMRCVRQACRLTGKAANLSIEGDNLLLDNRVLNRIADPIMHLLRNAIDHGLEASSEIRTSAGKSPQGNITLSFVNEGDTIKIICKDDGRGLNYGRVREIAVKRGLLNEDTETNTNLLNQIICMPGFTTREAASQTSGRGIGLDSVLADIRALKGNMTIESKANEGCTFTITVPTSILTSHALLVKVRTRRSTQYYALTSRAFEQIIYVESRDLIIEDGNTYFEFNQQRIPIHTLNELLGTINIEEVPISALLITHKHDGTTIGIAVEKIIASQAFVIKPLNQYAYPTPGVIGATILGDGRVSPVMDILELPSMKLTPEEFALVQEQREKILAHERANYEEPPAALIVDDSLSARRTLAQFVSDLGMDVYTAKDGYDAISVMEDKKPSLMLVDLEMPRMNGLELTAHVRSRREFKHIPIIMITSRSTSRHMEMARKAGVTRYLTKPWSDDELMSCIEKELTSTTKAMAS